LGLREFPPRPHPSEEFL